MVPNPIQMDDLGVPLFLETPMFLQQCIEQSRGDQCLWWKVRRESHFVDWFHPF